MTTIFKKNCSLHNSIKNSFCNTCLKLICDQCKPDHEKHEVMDLDAAISKYSMEYLPREEELKKALDLTSDYLQKSEQEEKRINEKRHQSLDYIEEQLGQVEEIMNDKNEDFTENIEWEFGKRNEELEKLEGETEKMISTLEETVNNYQSLVDKLESNEPKEILSTLQKFKETKELIKPFKESIFTQDIDHNLYIQSRQLYSISSLELYGHDFSGSIWTVPEKIFKNWEFESKIEILTKDMSFFDQTVTVTGRIIGDGYSQKVSFKREKNAKNIFVLQSKLAGHGDYEIILQVNEFDLPKCKLFIQDNKYTVCKWDKNNATNTSYSTHYNITNNQLTATKSQNNGTISCLRSTQIFKTGPIKFGIKIDKMGSNANTDGNTQIGITSSNYRFADSWLKSTNSFYIGGNQLKENDIIEIQVDFGKELAYIFNKDKKIKEQSIKGWNGIYLACAFRQTSTQISLLL
ncbi:hypothetical protein M0812_21094 [Anaeramoeba flamelloides]|uniref:B box-type domain-containing protein n=1 Tax=Anaeramoeba flamelloides TaxID=1746091 RepID=A0AAV7YQX4_9EUKA|nr:hypothetical protein M0812_21094 [Anaeramoeba flamelloides]